MKCFLITHGTDTVLIDTGWDSAVREHPIKTITYPMWVASKPLLNAGEAVDEQLKNLGITPSSLTYVLLTHMDIDHDSGLRLVKEAPRILLSPEEKKALRSGDLRYVKKPYKDINLETIKWTGSYGPYGKSWDVFGDGEVIVFITPGHTQGSVCVKLERNGKFTLVVGDSGYNEDSWIKGNLPGPVWNKDQMKKTLAWLNEQRQEPNCLGVYCAHDPSKKTRPQRIDLF